MGRIIDEKVEVRVNEKITQMKTYYEEEFRSVYKEIGLLRCEFEIYADQIRQAKIQKALQQFLQKDCELIEKKIKVNNLEQRAFIGKTSPQAESQNNFI